MNETSNDTNQQSSENPSPLHKTWEGLIGAPITAKPLKDLIAEVEKFDEAFKHHLSHTLGTIHSATAGDVMLPIHNVENFVHFNFTDKVIADLTDAEKMVFNSITTGLADIRGEFANLDPSTVLKSADTFFKNEETKLRNRIHRIIGSSVTPKLPDNPPSPPASGTTSMPEGSMPENDGSSLPEGSKPAGSEPIT